MPGTDTTPCGSSARPPVAAPRAIPRCSLSLPPSKIGSDNCGPKANAANPNYRSPTVAWPENPCCPTAVCSVESALPPMLAVAACRRVGKPDERGVARPTLTAGQWQTSVAASAAHLPSNSACKLRGGSAASKLRALIRSSRLAWRLGRRASDQPPRRGPKDVESVATPSAWRSSDSFRLCRATSRLSCHRQRVLHGT